MHFAATAVLPIYIYIYIYIYIDDVSSLETETQIRAAGDDRSSEAAISTIDLARRTILGVEIT